ncbi:hypothetical protein OAP14_10435 [Aliiglaciecola sp.]|nr:hypothetical protein [Aliiglaciecola sp.]
MVAKFRSRSAVLLLPISILLIVLCFKSSDAYSNQFFFDVERYSVKSGLPDSTVYSIAKDKQGFLWLGTPNGLSRFNGVDFDTFSAQTPHLTDIATRNNSNIFIDTQQRIWIGTWGQGVYVYDHSLELKYHIFYHIKGNSASTKRFSANIF